MRLSNFLICCFLLTAATAQTQIQPGADGYDFPTEDDFKLGNLELLIHAPPALPPAAHPAGDELPALTGDPAMPLPARAATKPNRLAAACRTTDNPESFFATFLSLLIPADLPAPAASATAKTADTRPYSY